MPRGRNGTVSPIRVRPCRVPAALSIGKVIIERRIRGKEAFCSLSGKEMVYNIKVFSQI